MPPFRKFELHFTVFFCILFLEDFCNMVDESQIGGFWIGRQQYKEKKHSSFRLEEKDAGKGSQQSWAAGCRLFTVRGGDPRHICHMRLFVLQ